MDKFKKDFPILMSRDVVYLDSGATSQKPASVIDAINNYYNNHNSNPHRGAYSLSIEATKAYEDGKSVV